MALTFYDQLPPVRNPNTPPLFSVRRDGAMVLNSVAATKLKQEKGGLVTLATDEQNAWFLIFGPITGRKPFVWKRQSGGNGSQAVQFFSTARAEECFAAHKANASVNRLFLEVGTEPESKDGMHAYRLSLVEMQASQRPAVDFTPPATPRPDEATMHRLNETVRTLAGLQLHKRPEKELMQAYGLLSQHADWVPAIAGGAKLLGKLRAEVG
jgi:hypothetical protein